MDRMAGLQDLQDRLFWLSCGLTMDRIAGLQDCRIAGLQELQDRLFWLSCGLTMVTIAGLQDLQDRLFWLSWGLFGQDGRINRIYRIRVLIKQTVVLEVICRD